MFDKSHRFSFKKGAPNRTYSAPFFVVRYQENSDKKLHFAAVVGKKVDKRAVARNKIKRRIVSITKELVDENTPFDLVIFAKKQINEATVELIYEELSKILKTTHIIS